MKKMLLVVLAVFAVSLVGYGQNASTSPNYKFSSVVLPDYLNKTKIVNKGAVAGIANSDSTASTTMKFIKDVTIMYPIAADTVLFGQYSLNSKIVVDTFFFGLTPATAGNPFVIPVNRVVDSTYFILRTSKGSKTATTYRSVAY